VADTEQTADAVYEALSARAVEAQVVAFGGRGWVRLSAAPYNEPADYERLADVLPDVLATAEGRAQAAAMSSASTIR
jgi:isopenicillin-N epimerase